MANKLRKLTVREVSLVDRGAGEGVRVEVSKRDGQRVVNMTQVTEVARGLGVPTRKLLKALSNSGFSGLLAIDVDATVPLDKATAPKPRKGQGKVTRLADQPGRFSDASESDDDEDDDAPDGSTWSYDTDGLAGNKDRGSVDGFNAAVRVARKRAAETGATPEQEFAKIFEAATPEERAILKRASAPAAAVRLTDIQKRERDATADPAYAQMLELAKGERRDGETVEQAFARLADTPEGVGLMRQIKANWLG
jgi:hypothetical protein